MCYYCNKTGRICKYAEISGDCNANYCHYNICDDTDIGDYLSDIDLLDILDEDEEE